VTRPQADLSRESLAFRVERLEAGHAPSVGVGNRLLQAEELEAASEPDSEPLPVELEQLQTAWSRAVIPAVQSRSIPIAASLHNARPVRLVDDRLTLEFPSTSRFARDQAEDNAELLREALHEVTGRRLALAFELGEAPHDEAVDDDRELDEDELIAMFKDRFDAREVDD